MALDLLKTGLRERPLKGEEEKDFHMTSVLKRLFPNEKWINNKGIRKADGKCYRTKRNGFYKPDFQIDDGHKKIIIQIYGAGGKNLKHYCEPDQVKKDIEDEKFYESIGYKVICIPMYIQLDSEMIKYYFDIEYTGQSLYPAASDHGFLHPEIALPKDFCKEGVIRFKSEMDVIPASVRKTVIETLKQRIKSERDKGFSEEFAKRNIIPQELDYLID